MLKNRYQEILVGLNLMSLIRGLISMRRNRATLLIDDKRFEADSYPGNYISEMEILALLRLGKRYEIPELLDIRQFLVPAQVSFFAGNTRLQMAQSPFANLRELLRKYPELIDQSDLDIVMNEGEKDFNRLFMQELSRYETSCFEMSSRTKGFRFDLQGPKWFKTIFQRFEMMINQEYEESLSLKYPGLLHLLGVSFEEKLKTRLAPEEIPFYFFRLLSPIWRLQNFFLMTQLKRRLNLLGGDYKESMVQYWQLFEGKFENLLLASFEGVISGERVLFFSHLPVEVPFSVASPFPFYRKTQMASLRRGAGAFPPKEVLFVAGTDQLGSERPYRSLAFNEELVSYQLPYLEMPGSKAEFYEGSLMEAFDHDAQMVPFEKAGLGSSPCQAVTLDMRQFREDRKNEAPVLNRLPLQITQKEGNVEGFEYWGPFRYRSLGLLALCYGVEGI